MKVLILMADGVEDCEALMTRDFLKRANIDVELCSINDSLTVKSQNDLIITCDKKSINNLNDYQALILPGGGMGTYNLDHYHKIDEIINYFVNNNKLIASICAAPSILGKRGLFKNHEYTCFTGCDNEIKEGKNTFKEVVESGNFITAKSVYYTFDFAYAITKFLLGKQQADKTINQIQSK